MLKVQSTKKVKNPVLNTETLLMQIQLTPCSLITFHFSLSTYYCFS